MFQPINSDLDVFNRLFVVDYGSNCVKVFNRNSTTPLFSFGENVLSLNQHGSVMPDVKILSNAAVTVTKEVLLDSVEAENTETTFNFNLENVNISEADFALTDGVETFEFADHVLTGSAGGTATLDLHSGVLSVTFKVAPLAESEISVAYKHHGNDKVFVSDSFNHCVRVFDLSGNLLNTIGSNGSSDGKFSFPSGLELNDGQLHVVDSNNHRVSVFNSGTLAFVQNYGSKAHTAAKGLYYPSDIVFVAGKGMYVTDTGHNRIVLFKLDTTTWTEEAEENYVTKDFNSIENSDRLAVLSISADVGVGGVGYFITDTFISNIQNFKTDWTKSDDITTTGKDTTKTKLPRGINFDDSSVAVVCDTGNNRLLEIS